MPYDFFKKLLKFCKSNFGTAIAHVENVPKFRFKLITVVFPYVNHKKLERMNIGSQYQA